MANQNQNQNNQNQNKKKGKGGGGGLRIVDFVFEGNKTDGVIEFRAMQGSLPKPNVKAEFYVGTSTRRFAQLLVTDIPATGAALARQEPWTITTLSNGVGTKAINLSGFGKEFTRLTISPPPISAATAAGGATTFIPTFEALTLDLPSDEQAPSGKPTIPKRKRLECKVPEGPLKSADNNFLLPAVKTVDKNGNAEEVEILFRATASMTLTDAITGAILKYNRKSANRVKRYLYKTPANGLVLAECQVEGDVECDLKIMRPDFPEDEASLKLKFDA